MAHTFEVGKTYCSRSMCDHEIIYSWTVTARTAKQITLEDKHGSVSKRGITIDGDIEFCNPDGRYSMAPVIRADREVF